MLSFFAAAIGNQWVLPGENEFILWFQGLAGQGSFLYYLMNFVSMLGEETVLVGIVGLIYWGLDKHRGEKIAFTMISATVFNPMIKNVVCRTRPFDSQSGIQNFRDVDGYSFPSGHSSNAAATYLGTSVAYWDKKQRWMLPVAIVISLLVALSRTYLGAHYPSDVVCGLALGVGLVFLVHYLFKAVPNKYWLYGGLIVIGLAGFFYCTTDDFFTAFGLLLGFTCGVLFENKITHFANTRIWWRIVLRVCVGGGLFLGANELIKLIVGAIYPSYKSNVWFEHIFRTLRYAVVTFGVIGVYPLLFAQTDKLWRKWGWIKSDEETDEQSNEEQSNEQSGEEAQNVG